MALLLRKVLGAVLNRPGSGSGPSSPRLALEGPEAEYISLGDLDRIPIDVLLQILRLLGPREVARTCLVCRTWRLVASDSRLWVSFLHSGPEPWECVLFAETHLRAGPPSKAYDTTAQLSFMQTYAQRAMVPGSIIIDGGMGYCKYGWSKYSSPSGRCATFLEFGSIETPMYARLRHFFSTIFTRMQVKPSSYPIVVVVPICHSDDTESARASRRQYREAVYKVLFDMNVPAVCAIDQAVLALYAAKRTSGIVVNIGFHSTSIVPIFRGKVMREIGVEVIGQGALKLTGYLKELMQQRNISFESLYTIRAIKEKLCYVAADYDAELRKDTQASCEVSGEGIFTLSRERFQTAEILFQPHMGGLRAMGLHRAVSLCIDHCYNSEILRGDDSWFKTIVLAGGSSCLPGLSERLENELKKIVPPTVAEGIKVLPPPYGTDSAWFGAKVVSNVSTFTETWCITIGQFRQKYRRNSSNLLPTW